MSDLTDSMEQAFRRISKEVATEVQDRLYVSKRPFEARVDKELSQNLRLHIDLVEKSPRGFYPRELYFELRYEATISRVYFCLYSNPQNILSPAGPVFLSLVEPATQSIVDKVMNLIVPRH